MPHAMSLTDNGLDVLAYFPGNDVQVHLEHYPLPDPALQVAEVAKLLIALEGTGGDPSDLPQGRSLEEPEGNDDERRKRKLDEEVQDRTSQKSVPLGSIDLTTTKRNMQRVPWSKEEKDAVNRQLWDFIANAKVPRKNDCEQCKLQEPCLRNRHWKKIKDFIRNRIRTDARRRQRGVCSQR